MTNVNQSTRYQSRYWILVYSAVFNSTEYERFLASKDVQAFAIFKTIVDQNPQTLVFIFFNKPKELKYNPSNFLLIQPKEFRNPTYPMIIKLNGIKKFDSFLQSVLTGASDYGDCEAVVCDEYGGLKFIGKKEINYFENFDVTLLKEMSEDEVTNFYSAFYVFAKNAFTQMSVVLVIFKQLMNNYLMSSFRDQFFFILLKEKSGFIYIVDTLNFLLKEFSQVQDQLVLDLDKKKQNKRVEKLMKTPVESNKTNNFKESQLKVENLEESVETITFNFSNQEYEKLKQQILKDDYQKIDYVSIFKVDVKIFTDFLKTILDESKINLNKTQNKVIRFLSMEFGYDKPFKPSFRSNDKLKWFKELYPYLPDDKKEKYKRNI